MKMKDAMCTAIGITGGMVASFFGGWTSGMSTLVILIVIDYVSGLTVAGVFGKSLKTPHGGLESKAGWKGLCRKVMTLLLIGISYRLDLTLGTTCIKDAMVIGFMVNELISILENAGLMGLPVPRTLKKAIDILKLKNEEEKK